MNGVILMDNKKCPKCNGEMIKASIKGHFSGFRNDEVVDGTNTTRYMCKDCGYIEEYADNPKFINKRI